MDIPIFREEFLELNKTRESELRSLRKTVSEFEEQNAVLQRHVDNMRSAVAKLDRDVTLTKENNVALEHHPSELLASCDDGVNCSRRGMPVMRYCQR